MTALDPNVYRKAADEIRTHGHTKRAFDGPNGEHCINGAIMAARKSIDGLNEYAEPLAEMIGKPRGGWLFLAFWNDEPERTPEDCITLLNQAYEKLQADQ